MSCLPEESSLHTEVAGSASPDAFGPFRVLHQIGAGALGPVFRAYDPERDRLVAVKVFRLDLPPERVHQMVSEFERLIEAGLRHPGIATPVATGLNGVVAYLAQDFFSGDSLDIVTRERGALPLSEALPAARQLAEALDFAAERDVEHGGLHPRDVLLSPEGTRIVGFGITRALEHIGAAVPIRRPYTAPERVEGAAWDRRADVFGLAAVVHEMLWARRLVGTGMQAVEAMTPLPGTHLTALQTVFSRALAEQPIDRFATAIEFVESLEAAAGMDVAADIPLPVVEPQRNAQVTEPQRNAQASELLLPLEDDLPLDDYLPIAEGDTDVRVVEHDIPFAQLDAPEPEPLESLEPLEPLEPLAPVKPAKVESFWEASKVKAPEPPPFLASTPSFAPSSSSSLVWPIGLACVVGLAIGFGVGYTAGSRDRPSVAPPPAAASPASPAASDFTDVPVAPKPAPSQPAKADVAPKPAPAQPPKADVAPPVPFSGRLVVRSTPAGARVFVDGRDRGATPVAVAELGRGDHTVRIVRDGYTAAERRIVLTPDRPSQQLTVPLAKAPSQPSKAAVAAKPGVIPPAKADAKAEPKPGAIAGAEAGTLVLDSRPSGATAFVDGRAVGKTPLTLADVKAGDHNVRFELAGHFPWTVSITVVGGTSNRVGGSLEKID